MPARCPRCYDLMPCQRHRKPFASARQSGFYGARWRKARAAFLALHPWCGQCWHAGKRVRATVVDHNTPHRGNAELFWNQRNWRALCKPHHDAKTGRETAERRGGGCKSLQPSTP